MSIGTSVKKSIRRTIKKKVSIKQMLSQAGHCMPNMVVVPRAIFWMCQKYVESVD